MPGKSIRIYLADGTLGIRHAKVVNWTGKAIVVPRHRLSELRGWEQSQRPGVYFLFGEDPATGEELAYIGESENVFDRLRRGPGVKMKLYAVARAGARLRQSRWPCEGRACGLNLGEDCARVSEKSGAFGQQLHASRCPAKERRAQFVFEVADLPAQRRLRDVQATGSAADVLLLGDRDEVGDLRQAHA